MGGRFARVVLNGHGPGPALQRTAPAIYVWHLGPRLMFSLASRGFPTAVSRAAVVLARTRGSVRLVLVTGEIDVRCHLVGRTTGLGFVRDYVRRGLDLGRAMRARDLLFVIPPPPSLSTPVAPGFPVVGTLAERRGAFDALRAELGCAVAGAAGRHGLAVRVADLTDVLVGRDGGLAAHLTDDGIHTNPAGARLVRQTLLAKGLVGSAGLDA